MTFAPIASASRTRACHARSSRVTRPISRTGARAERSSDATSATTAAAGPETASGM